jgi:MtN3 and saliva related transmembrane protein
MPSAQPTPTPFPQMTFTRDFFGYTGGIFLSICTIPQIYLMYSTKSAKDVSLSYAILYFIGLSLTLVYLVLEEALAGVITMTFEVFLAAVVIALKLYLDRIYNGAGLLGSCDAVKVASEESAPPEAIITQI